MNRRRVRVAAAAATLVALVALAGDALAHAGGIRSASSESLAVPTWLFLATGGGVIGASFLLASFVTDRAFVRRVDAWGDALPEPGRVAVLAGRAVGLAGLALVFVAGFAGPADGPNTAVRNAAVLLVWAGWWGAYVTSTYLVGNTWPVVNPFRTLAAPLPSLDRPYPERLGSWPAVGGLLAVVYLEVVTPLASDPRLLASTVACYGVLTLAGSVVFGADTWFSTADPVSRLLAAYGRVAPVARTADGVRVRLPGMGLTDADWVRDRSDVGFVVCVVFVTTFDGFVGTDLWGALVTPVVTGGVPAPAAYLGGMLLGFGLFYAAYLGAAGAARRYADTFVSAVTLARRYAPSLLAIAAGYHLAHNLTTTLTLAPTLAVVAASPLSPPAAVDLPTLSVPAWVGGVTVASILAGHLVAVWVAHATAYDLFPDRLQAIRSQYGVTVAMVAYTMVSLWVLTRPGGAPPFV
ncbi:hypothetical protein [Candidatus Halobonum tyrrellensis]|uniref:Uncharacterized protein n=1 Tax=Candidatus Halobonum tyrrellensis G22 TaxID=1324957 RepID=V4GRE2_9EURY|nr:hypothetical protein [Candidatus Halobonum tyrrellensis]ESP87626.1 hypothetical protein K933_12947 [Candidatus Halobonum tyrrellensis G22]